MPSNIPATTIRIEPEVKKEATVIPAELAAFSAGSVSFPENERVGFELANL